MLLRAARKAHTIVHRTREGGFGWLFIGVDVHDDTLQPGGPAGEDLELNPVAFKKGRRYAYALVWDGGPGGRT